MVRIVGSFEDAELKAFATRLDDAGIVCQCWHFFDETRVVLSVHAPDEPRRVDAMTQLLDAAGARLV